MAFGLNGTNQGITGGTVVSGFPFTMALSFNSSSDAVNQFVLNLTKSYVNDSYFALVLAGAVAGDYVRAAVVEGTSNAASISENGYQANVWHSAAAEFASASSRKIFIGIASNQNSDTIDSTFNGKALSIGYINRLTPAFYFVGNLANCAIWSVALTDAEIASLAKGFSPRRIRPQSLVFYAPLIRNLQDVRRGLALTPENDPTVSAHPRVYA